MSPNSLVLGDRCEYSKVVRCIIGTPEANGSFRCFGSLFLTLAEIGSGKQRPENELLV